MRRSRLSALLIEGALASATVAAAVAAPVPRTLPENAPDTGIRNVPATTGRANRAASAPPLTVTRIGKFDEPFAMAFLPGGDLLVTEKAGTLKLRAANGTVARVARIPGVGAGGQGGLLDVALAPDFGTSRAIYLTYSEGPTSDDSQLALARATLVRDRAPRLDGLKVLWRSGSRGPGGQFGANIAFAPDGRSLFLSSGERQRFSPAQDPDQALGKVLRLTLDGKAWPGNPQFKAGGVRAQTWSTGHRNPYGMVLAPDGRLWEEEMGPMGGDELNLVLPGRNYGWPIVSNGDNYSGKPIPDHPSRPDLEAPKLWWRPSVSPGGMILYSGAMFPQYRGNLLIGTLSGEALIRVALNGDRATALDQWAMRARIRDIAQASDGAIWLLEDDGALVRLTPPRG